MPLYEYTCEHIECDKEAFEVLVDYDSTEEIRCPACRYPTENRKDFYQFNFSI